MSAAGHPADRGGDGPCTAGGAYVPAMSDDGVIVNRTGTIFLGGPPLVRAATGEDVTAEELGGARLHCRQSGVSDTTREERRATRCGIARGTWRTLTGSSPPLRPGIAPREDPRYSRRTSTASCSGSRKPYDVREVIARLVDGSDFLEFKSATGHTLVCGLAHVHGLPRGHPRQQRGPLLPQRAEGRAASSQTVRPAGIPLLFLQNITGYGRAGDTSGRHHQGRPQARQRGRDRHRAEAHRRDRRSLARAITASAGAPTRRASCGRGPTRRSPSWAASRPQPCWRSCGGKASRRRAALGARRKRKPSKAPVRAQFDAQADAYYATARLWDDGVIDPQYAHGAGARDLRRDERSGGRAPLRRLQM